LSGQGVQDRPLQAETEQDQAEAYRAYISDMLAELAELAGVHGDKQLALTLQMAALDAARRPPERRAG
jgi:hypothetical protein